MGATRFFVAGVYAAGDAVELAAGDARKLRVVLHRGPGDAVEIVDSSGRTFAGVLEAGAASGVRARLARELSAPAPARLRITLAQGIPKGQKMDFVIEKATELGVAAVLPFSSRRTAGDGTRAGKVERWRRIALSAAQQSGRTDVSDIAAPVAFDALIARFADFDRTLVPWELAERVPLRERLPQALSDAGSVCVVIGPEGGLCAEEVERAQAAGAVLVSLGSRILRTETAGLVACSALLYASGDL